MCRFLTGCVALIAITAVNADDKPKSNTLTPKEAADGWLLLFDGETTFGWIDRKVVNKDYYTFAAKDGALLMEGRNGGMVSIEHATPFRHFELVGEYRLSGLADYARCHVQVNVRHENPIVGNARSMELPASKEWKSFSMRIAPDGVRSTIADKVIQDWKARTGKDKDQFAPVIVQECRIQFFTPERTDTRCEFRNLKLRPLDGVPLFNGKNLDGWRVNNADPKRMSSKFEVTKDGELSVKNGPGDLVADKEFADFVLQFDCKTLGRGLNSGIFFRCIPGQYQNGYEAQVQNLFRDDDRTKPVDFGTGAIYRRIPARKVVSNDNEWFTMTVAASGKHIATWVNGYQTVDWTDDRKENDNPRQGYRAAKGPLSIQGHDPTTDLLFRNIRIAEIPPKKE
jgi:3-keto-disaccharide hydrolase